MPTSPKKKVESIRLLKIDVEGAELPALRGGQRTLDQFHPIIHFEYFAPLDEGVWL